jgi:hypothetical protein
MLRNASEVHSDAGNGRLASPRSATASSLSVSLPGVSGGVIIPRMAKVALVVVGVIVLLLVTFANPT